MNTIVKPVPRDEMIVMDSKRYIVSKTDSKGFITYANDYFCEISGYEQRELLGQPHNIVRHPDMPRVCFKLMWDTIKQGKDFKALVKNLAKDGRYYWVFTKFETQYHPQTKEIIGYVAYRKAASEKAIKAIEPVYEKMLEYEKIGGMDASAKFLTDTLSEKKLSYNEYIDKLNNYNAITKIFFDMMKTLFGK
ncbi:MAG: PAS domain-containing protein [Campylobacter sp.]